MRKIFVSLWLLYASSLFAQVGIGTNNPLTDLHIASPSPDSGGIQIDGSIYLGGNNTTLGNSGTEGQVLTIGPNGKPQWSGGNITINSPTGGTYTFIGDCATGFDTSSVAAIKYDVFSTGNPVVEPELVTAMASSDIISIYYDTPTPSSAYAEIFLPDAADPAYLNRNFIFFSDDSFF